MDEDRRLALVILGIIADATMRPGRGSYIASWGITHALEAIGYRDVSMAVMLPGTAYDRALQSLLEDGIVEELPELHLRYRLRMKERQGISLAKEESI